MKNRMQSGAEMPKSHKKWILGGMIVGLLFVSVVTVGILSSMGVIGGKDAPVQTDADEKSTQPSSDSGHTPKEAGLYDSDGKMTKTWEELQKEGMITVEDHSLQYADVMAQLSGQLVIGEGITGIGESAFSDCSSLTGITIPDSVTSIGGSAFRNCISLTSITIPDGVTGIGEYAFWNCGDLASITIPDSVTSIGGCAFSDCSSLTSITIPDSVTSIGEYAFFGCGKLKSITIPDSVTSIGESAFRSCKKLKSITIPDRVTRIGEDAFSEIPVVYYNGTASGRPWGAKAVKKHGSRHH